MMDSKKPPEQAAAKSNLEAIDEAASEAHGLGSSVDDDDSRDRHDDLRQLAKNDTKRIRFWKLVVAVMIGLAGAVVSVGINRYLKEQQEREIDDNFDLFSNTIEDVAQIHFKSLFDAFNGLSNSLTSEAITLNMTFPFVTFPSFEVLAHQARVASKVEVIGFTPRIENEQTLAEWNEYALENERWVEEAHRIERQLDPAAPDYQPFQLPPFAYNLIVNPETGERNMVPPSGEGPFTPLWMNSPPPRSPYLMKVNTLVIDIAGSHPQEGLASLQETLLGVPSDRTTQFSDTLLSPQRHQRLHNDYLGTNNTYQAHVTVAAPIFDSFDKATRKHVGDLLGIFAMESFLINLLPEGVRGVYVVVENTCGKIFTFRLDGNRAFFLGEGEFSKVDSRHRNRTIVFDQFYDNREIHWNSESSCIYHFHIYSSDEFIGIFSDDFPMIFGLVIAFIFLVMAVTFFMYDVFVQRRNNRIMGAAVRSTAIVNELFPSNVHNRLYGESLNPGGGKRLALAASSTAKLKRFVDEKGGSYENDDDVDNDGEDIILKSKPIADLFPETTVMFCDIAGFTAWSSVREPSQVFTLLETVYRAFDRIAKRRKVFKVETVGDCYVAVAGCPDPMKNHASVMGRFALECLSTMDTLTKQLEVTLGPDTGDLHVRIGLHSGPVTAGVLRGERARFQLFGDTMNTAARMESTGQRGRVQVSEETAELLIKDGKKHWLVQRAEKVNAKGKGALQTFWIVDHSGDSDSKSAQETSPVVPAEGIAKERTSRRGSMSKNQTFASDGKTERLINWNIDVLQRLLKQVIARRISLGLANARVDKGTEEEVDHRGGSVLSEVKEIIALPHFNAAAFKNEQNSESIVLNSHVKEELALYVSRVAAMYRGNSFHNFEHASHVTMSVVKLLSRIVAPTDEVFEDQDHGKKASTMHDHTFGITSDPLTQFACVLSALIHDADHPGVPNAQLVKEQNRLALFYRGQSVAEQNSVDLCWQLLMEEDYNSLRQAIYGTKDEMERFRQLVVNSVMATDIVDKPLKELRNARWEKAFSELSADDNDIKQDDINRKATIVIEHLIQASDVAHTMQHWHIYRKWNERFFLECFKAYRSGRGGETNPADNWYRGELGFFDFYIIPLAKKLKNCGVFGVSSDEYLNYAQKNRQEWEIRGQEIVASMVDKVAADGV